MLSFWEVLKKALSYKDAAVSAAVALGGWVSSAILPKVIVDKSLLNFLLLGICFISFIMIERVSAYVKAIRMQDLENHGHKVYKDR